MKNLTIISKIQIFESLDELPEELATLLHKAQQAALNAYAPYSQFKVGAALMLNNGKIITGNNQENAAYPSGLCAERTVAFYASSQYPQTPFARIAIAAITQEKKLSAPIAPCGSCRQTLLEYENKFDQNIELILSGQSGDIYLIPSIKTLLPCAFDASFFKY